LKQAARLAAGYGPELYDSYSARGTEALRFRAEQGPLVKPTSLGLGCCGEGDLYRNE